MMVYDPGAHRWLNRDPIGEIGGLNLYSFAGNDPVIYVDPVGLNPVFDNPGNIPDLYGSLYSCHKDRNEHQNCPANEPKNEPSWKPDKFNWGNTDPKKGHIGNCYRSRTGKLGGAQCCYLNGKLNSSDPGSYDFISPGNSYWNPRTWGHIVVDVIPAIIWGN